MFRQTFELHIDPPIALLYASYPSSNSLPIPKWLKGAPTLPRYEQDPRNVGSTNFAYSGMIGGSPDLAGLPSPAEIELWRKQRAEKVVRGKGPCMLLCSDALGFDGICWLQTD